MIRKRSFSLVVALGLAACAGYVGAANRAPAASSPATSLPASPGSARFATYNVAQGTRMPAPRVLVRDTTVQANLDQIGLTLRAYRPLVVALQETDWGPEHPVERIARAGGFSSWLDDASVTADKARHGSALVSAEGFEEPTTALFPPGTTFRKGWVAATVHVPAFGGQPVRVVAVHLDPLSPEVRQRQSDQLVLALERETRPLVVMGDFNCEWAESGCVQIVAKRLNLTEAGTHDSPTYRFAGIRRNLDWILVSPELRIIDTRVVDDPYSDHCAVYADVALADGAS